MKNKIICIFLFAILATAGIVSAAANDSDGDGIIDYLDPFPNQAEAAGPGWSVGDYYNFTFTTPTFAGYLYSTVVEIKTIEVFDQNGTSMGKQEFYILNRTHPQQGLIQVYFTSKGKNLYKMDYLDPNLLDVTFVPSHEWFNLPLYDGKNWSYNYTRFLSNATINRSFKLTYEGAVVGRETINYADGTFECYVVDINWRNATTGSLFAHFKQWVSVNPELPIPHFKHEMYNVTTGAPSETWFPNKFSLVQRSEAGDIYVVKTPASPTPTKPAPGFELIATVLGGIIAIYLRKPRF